MFTAKFYGHTGRILILPADSFTVLEGDTGREFEVSLHTKGEDSVRYDIGPAVEDAARPEVFDTVYIVNRDGKTVASFRSYVG